MKTAKHLSQTENEPKLSEIQLKKWEEKRFKEVSKLNNEMSIIDESRIVPYGLEYEEEEP